MKYTKENSLLNSDPNKKVGNVTVPRALVYGSYQDTTTSSELVKLWQSKKRQVPMALMLAKAECESGFHPYVFRYEVGQHLDYQNGWLSKSKGNSEFDATSGGLFQILGKNVKQYGWKDWTSLQELSAQLDAFDSFMGNCLAIAKRTVDGKEIDDIYQAINIYAYGGGQKTINWKNTLADKNFKEYKKYKKLYP
jgi:hypothetical protein